MKELEEKIEDFLKVMEEQKGDDPIVVRIPPDNSIADAMITCSASSRRHTQGIADAIAKMCHEKGYEVLGIEGKQEADWILLDCNDIIVHILREEIRNLYRLEDLWAAASQYKENKE